MTFTIIKKLIAQKLQIRADADSLRLPDYENLAELQVKKNIEAGVSLDEFHELKLKKNRRKLTRLATLNSKEKKVINEEDQERKNAKFIIRLRSDFRLYWDLWIIFLAIWNAIYIPFDVAFKPPVSETPGMIFFNAFIDFNFTIDIILTFRTTYYDKDRQEVFNSKKIALNYLMGRFFIDFISTVPLDQIGNLPILQMFQLLKLIRLSR